jgi:hypothetical protein
VCSAAEHRGCNRLRSVANCQGIVLQLIRAASMQVAMYWCKHYINSPPPAAHSLLACVLGCSAAAGACTPSPGTGRNAATGRQPAGTSQHSDQTQDVTAEELLRFSSSAVLCTELPDADSKKVIKPCVCLSEH